MSILDSQFIIDGIPEDLTLRELLDPESASGASEKTITDESILEDLTLPDYDVARISRYGSLLASKIKDGQKSFSLTHSEFCTIRDLSSAIIKTLFCDGIFELNELEMILQWKWNTEKIGNAASLYSSVRAAADFLEGLNVRISDYDIKESGKCAFEPECSGVTSKRDFLDFVATASGDKTQVSDKAFIQGNQIVDEQLLAQEDSYVIFIPFDQAAPSLAGSSFSAFVSHVGTGVPSIGDPDYFSDCYQICREFIKDGIALSAVEVGLGGLYTAASRLADGGCGLDLSIGSLESLNPSKNIVEILFSEIPGVLLQISSFDRDYADTELILQEVAYYTVGKPTLGHKGLKVLSVNGGSVSHIIDLLLASQPEGED